MQRKPLLQQKKTWTEIRQRQETIWKKVLQEYLPTLNVRRKLTNQETKLEANHVAWVWKSGIREDIEP